MREEDTVCVGSDGLQYCIDFRIHQEGVPKGLNNKHGFWHALFFDPVEI